VATSGTPLDLKAAHAIQDSIQMYPIAEDGTPLEPPAATVDPTISDNTPIQQQVEALTAAQYFDLLARLLAHNPAVVEDRPLLERASRIGIFPGKPFDWEALRPEVREALDPVPRRARDVITERLAKRMHLTNGWRYRIEDEGRYTRHRIDAEQYLDRAADAAGGLEAVRPQDIVYAIAQADIPRSDAHRLEQIRGALP
jgi:hypothetical protein